MLLVISPIVVIHYDQCLSPADRLSLEDDHHRSWLSFSLSLSLTCWFSFLMMATAITNQLWAGNHNSNQWRCVISTEKAQPNSGSQWILWLHVSWNELIFYSMSRDYTPCLPPLPCMSTEALRCSWGQISGDLLLLEDEPLSIQTSHYREQQ